MPKRNGRRKTREELSKRRAPELGYYFIVTDTEETEQNYMLGLRDSIPKELQGKLVIKVCKTKTVELVKEALREASLHPQYSEPWIVFDRDQVSEFDQIISAAEKAKIHVGWSNPCIEIWFSAYLDSMPSCDDSVSCCNDFARKFLKATGQKYEKSDKNIYRKLCDCGDEERAIGIARKKLAEHLKNGNSKPSKMSPCTTLHSLIEEITGKIKKP